MNLTLFGEKMKIVVKKLLLISLVLFVNVGLAQILYVSSESGSDSNPGTDNAPFKSIQKAVDSASNGDEIYIAAFDVDSISSSNSCTYTGTGDNVIVLTNNINLSLFGGYIYTHIIGNNWFRGIIPSKVDGENSRRCLHINNNESITNEIGEISFENGKAERGGNIYAESGNIQFLATVIKNGTAVYGGGIYLENSFIKFSTNGISGGIIPELNGLILIQNNYADYGGGMYIDGGMPMLFGIGFYQNTAGQNGGAAYIDRGAPIIIAGAALQNYSSNYGGAFYLDSSAARVAQMEIKNNYAVDGGAFYIDGPLAFSQTTVPVIVNNYVISNVASRAGGGYYFKLAVAGLVNNIIAENSATDGAAMYLYGSSPICFFSTVVSNSGNAAVYVTHQPGQIWPPIAPIPSYPSFTNSIFCGHQSTFFVDSTGFSPPLENSVGLVATLWHNTGSEFSGSGDWSTLSNYYGDPLFTCTGGLPDCPRPFHISSNSPAVDVGVEADPYLLPGSDMVFDIDLNLRPSGKGYDLGADEVVVSNSFGLKLVPESITHPANKSTTITNVHLLVNAGGITRNVSLSFTNSIASWAADVSPASVVLPGENYTNITVVITVPANAEQTNNTVIFAVADSETNSAIDITPVGIDTNVYNPNVLSYGIYWFGKNNQKEKFVVGETNKFFNPEKPTHIFVHGWQPNISAVYPPTFIYNYGETGVVDTAFSWITNGWNVGIFFWNQFSDENLVTNAEIKIWTTNSHVRMRWKNGMGLYEEAPEGTKSAAELFLDDYIGAMTNQNFTGGNIRISGHSLGNQMAVRMTKLLADKITSGIAPVNILPDRIALLDPYWSIGQKSYLGGKKNSTVIREYVEELISSNNIAFEWYRSSDLTVEPYGDSNPDLEPLVMYVEMYPDFTTDQMIKHCAAYRLYDWSLSFAGPGDCSGPACLNISNLLAQVSDSQVKYLMTEAQNYQWMQSEGMTTETPEDDRYVSVAIPEPGGILWIVGFLGLWIGGFRVQS